MAGRLRHRAIVQGAQSVVVINAPVGECHRDAQREVALVPATMVRGESASKADTMRGGEDTKLQNCAVPLPVGYSGTRRQLQGRRAKHFSAITAPPRSADCLRRSNAYPRADPKREIGVPVG